MHGEETTITRNIRAIQIPYGQEVPLPKGSHIMVHQVLGGNFTVVTDQGLMVRIDAKDVDALGELGQRAKAEAEKHLASTATAPQLPADMPADQQEVVKKIWEQLRTCYDPEIPVNIVELGLIYEMDVLRVPDGFKVAIKMSLTAPGCGMGPVLQQDVQAKVAAIAGVKSVQCEVVFDPPWDPSRMTEAARLQLGML